jgi:hypothetical protein
MNTAQLNETESYFDVTVNTTGQEYFDDLVEVLPRIDLARSFICRQEGRQKERG